jgi:hypothetical protein
MFRKKQNEIKVDKTDELTDMICKEFKASKKVYYKVMEEGHHAMIDANTDRDVFMLCFPNSKEDALRAFLAHTFLSAEN